VAARTGDAELTTATDPLGRFHLEIVSSWPDRLRIDATGLASRHLSLPKAHKSYDAGTIPLQRGGQLVVTVADPDEALTADLLTKENRKWTTIATARLENGVITFDRIESGDYRLLLRGGEPLQRVTTAVEVRDGDTTRETIELERARLTIVVKQRGSRVPRTDVVVMPAEQDWSSSVVAGGETDPEFELWQSGEFLAFVGEGPGGTIARQLLPAQSEVVWNIDLPAHRVSGIVLDASAKPLAQASVTLVTAHADEGTTATTTTDAAGQFVFDAVPHGQQRLRAAAPNHLPGEHHFALAASDPDYHTTLRLRKSAAIRIAVADAASRPLAEALVTDGQSISTRTDAAGEATIDLAPAEQKQIYIVPLSGSFASTTIRADGDPRTDPVRIEVPPGSATLRVTAMDQDKKPLANVYIAIRADGLMIPPNIRTAMRNHRGDPVATGPDGVAVLANFPSGVYELWPYFNRSELTAIVNGSVAPAATVLAQPGTNVVTFTFDRTSARDFLPAPKAAALPPHSEIQLQLP
jgi:hypothetical protein